MTGSQPYTKTSYALEHEQGKVWSGRDAPEGSAQTMCSSMMTQGWTWSVVAKAPERNARVSYSSPHRKALQGTRRVQVMQVAGGDAALLRVSTGRCPPIATEHRHNY